MARAAFGAGPGFVIGAGRGKRSGIMTEEPPFRRTLLIVAHAPSENTARLRDAAALGARDPDIEGVACRILSPFDTGPDDVLSAAGLLLITPENLGSMAGATKDFFDRCYMPCLDRTQGLPFRLIVRAGHDGTGTCRQVETIATCLRWRSVEAPLVCRGPWDEGFLGQAQEVGLHMAAGLEAGIF